MEQISEARMFVRVTYTRETGLLFSNDIGKYGDWMEKKLAEIYEQTMKAVEENKHSAN